MSLDSRKHKKPQPPLGPDGKRKFIPGNYVSPYIAENAGPEIQCSEPIYANCSANQYKISSAQHSAMHARCGDPNEIPDEAEKTATNMYDTFIKTSSFITADGTNPSVTDQIIAVFSAGNNAQYQYGTFKSLLCRLASASTQCVDTSGVSQNFLLWWKVNVLGITPIENIVYFLSALTVLYINFKIITQMITGKSQFFENVAPCISSASKQMFGQQTGGKILPIVITALVVFFLFVIVGGLLLSADSELGKPNDPTNVGSPTKPEIIDIDPDTNATNTALERAKIQAEQYRQLAMWVIVYISGIVLVLSLVLNKLESTNTVIAILSNLTKLASFGIIIAFNLFFTGIMPQLLLVTLVGQRFLMGDYAFNSGSIDAMLSSPVVVKLFLGVLISAALIGVSLYWNTWTVSSILFVFIGITLVIGLCNYNSFYKAAKESGNVAYWSLVLMPVFNYFMNITQSNIKHFISPAHYGVANSSIF